MAVLAVVAGGVLAMAGTAGATSGVVGSWLLDEGSGATAADASGMGNAGTLAAGATWIPGKRGRALHFDGAGGNVRVPSSASLEPAAMTVQAWVRDGASPGLFKHIVAKGAAQCMAASYALYSGPDGGLDFYVSGAGGTSFTRSPDAGTRVWDGGWHLATGTFDGTTVRLYVDGVEVGTGTARSQPVDYALADTRDLSIGSYAGCPDHDFSGDVDEAMVLDHAMTASEVKAQLGYAWTGFFQPVDDQPTLNGVKAGSAVPVKFSLGGNQGLGVLAIGSPGSTAISCSTTAPVDAVEQLLTASQSGLTYDAVADQYVYVWKTDKSWAGTCRRLTVALGDGSVHQADFKF